MFTKGSGCSLKVWQGLASSAQEVTKKWSHLQRQLLLRPRSCRGNGPPICSSLPAPQIAEGQDTTNGAETDVTVFLFFNAGLTTGSMVQTMFLDNNAKHKEKYVKLSESSQKLFTSVGWIYWGRGERNKLWSKTHLELFCLSVIQTKPKGRTFYRLVIWWKCRKMDTDNCIIFCTTQRVNASLDDLQSHKDDMLKMKRLCRSLCWSPKREGVFFSSSILTMSAVTGIYWLNGSRRPFK